MQEPALKGNRAHDNRKLIRHNKNMTARVPFYSINKNPSPNTDCEQSCLLPLAWPLQPWPLADVVYWQLLHQSLYLFAHVWEHHPLQRRTLQPAHQRLITCPGVRADSKSNVLTLQ